MRIKIGFYKTILLAVVLFAVSLKSGDLYAANNFTLAVQSATAVTMGDASGIIPVTITNDSASTDYIGYVKISFDADIYYVGNDTAAPAGWQMTFPVTNGAGQAFAEFSVIDPTNPAYRIDPGESLIFYVVITGPKSGSDYLPIQSGPSDVTDYVLDKCHTPSKSSDVRKTKTSAAFTQLGTCGCGAGQIQDCFARKALYSSITASPSSVGAGGTITIIQTVTNRSTASQTSVRPSITNMIVGNGITRTDTADAILPSGPLPASQTLATGVSQTYQWTYTASGSGSLQFCNSATNSGGTATSLTSCSNAVSIGNFTANLSISPAQIVSGQAVTVTLTVKNNGSTNITNITPYLTEPGTVGWAKVSGPAPANLGGLIPGESDIFQWVYTITGNVNDTFTFSGYATSGALTTMPNPAISNQGKISAYSVTVMPANVCSASTNVSFTFRIYNAGVYNIQQVQIYTPTGSPAFPNPSAPATQTCGANGTIAGSVATYSSITGFTPGTSCDFTVTYATLPSVTQNSDYSFSIKIWDTQTPTNKDPRANVGAIVKITKYCMTILALPSSLGPNCTASVIATVTPNPCNPQDTIACPDPNQEGTVNFTATGGTLKDVTKITTTSGGEAQATYKAPSPYSASLTSVTVSASFQDISASTNISLTNTTACPNVKKIRWREVVQ